MLDRSGLRAGYTSVGANLGGRGQVGMKTPEDDFYLGRAVLERTLVAREALLECLFQMSQERRSGVPRPLGVLLVSRGLLTQEELNEILRERVSAAGTVSAL